MNTALRVHAPQDRTIGRVPLLAGATALIATASVAVTLAVAGGEAETSSGSSAAPATAVPDRATLYQRNAETPKPVGGIDGRRSAERFHHFR
jgi:hypothetical protein